MKKIALVLLFLTSLFSFSQNDTISLREIFIVQYELTKSGLSELDDFNKCIETGLKYRSLKNDKTTISLVLGNLYYGKSLHFKQPKKEKYFVSKFRGYLPKEQQTEALIEAKKYYEYYVTNTKLFDDNYRAAQSGILVIESKLGL